LFDKYHVKLSLFTPKSKEKAACINVSQRIHGLLKISATCGETMTNSQHRTEQKRKKHRCKNVTETFLSELFRNSKVDLSQPSIIKKNVFKLHSKPLKQKLWHFLSTQVLNSYPANVKNVVSS
jgi:hypothetical protein